MYVSKWLLFRYKEEWDFGICIKIDGSVRFNVFFYVCGN